MAQPAQRFLEIFTADDKVPLPAGLGARLEQGPSRHVSAAATGFELEQDYERGIAEGRARADAILESEIARLAVEYDGKLAEAKALFSRDLADRLVCELQEGLDRLHETIAEQVLTVLLPVLRHALADASIRALSEELKQLAQDEEAASVELSGPQELIDQLWCRYLEIANEPANGRINFVRREQKSSAQLRFVINGRIIESRLTEWMAKIAEAVS